MFIFNRIVFILNHILILVLLISALAPFITPVLSWQIAFLGLAFPVLIFLNVLFILYWAIQLKLKFIFSLAALVICWNYIPRYIQFNSVTSASDKENTIKIISFNSRYFGYFDKTESEDEDLFFEKLDKINPDIICLQEMFNGAVMSNNLIKRFEEKYKNYHRANIKQGVWMVDNIGIVSKYPICGKGTVEHDTSSGNYTIYADIVKGKDTIRLVTTHLQSIAFKKDDYNAIKNISDKQIDSTELFRLGKMATKIKSAFLMRSKQVDEIKEFIRNSPYKIILCGDFNDSPVSYAYRTLRGEMKDAFIESGTGLGRTYVGPMPALRIDYIFSDPTFSISNYYAKSFDFSDHKMVSCTIKIK